MSDELQTNRTDRVVTSAKAVFGMVPIAGSVLSEVIGEVIPNQRMERLVKFVEKLGERVEHMEADAFGERCRIPDCVNLIEDALFLAARAKSDERLDHIASIVANGISEDEQKRIQADKMLWILEKLNDVEVVLLRGSLPRTREEHDFDFEYRNKHREILAPKTPTRGSDWSEVEEAAMFDSFRQHLVELNLVRVRYQKPKRNELPEFDDKTGMMKAGGRELTLLGRMFLQYLDLIPHWVREQ